MHTIPSLLPSLYDWSFWVPFFFRLFLAYQLYQESRRLMRGEAIPLTTTANNTPTPSARRTLAWVMIVLSALFFVGLGIQIIAVFTACAFAVRIFQVSRRTEKNPALIQLLTLSALVSFSLLFLGPGPYAVDLPL